MSSPTTSLISDEDRGLQQVTYKPIDYQEIIYCAAPKPKKVISSMDEVDVEPVWDPIWGRERMSEVALLQLGMYG